MEGDDRLILGKKYPINGSDLREWFYVGMVGASNDKYHFIRKLEKEVLASVVIPTEELTIVDEKIEGEHITKTVYKEINVEMYMKLLEALEGVNQKHL